VAVNDVFVPTSDDCTTAVVQTLGCPPDWTA
jgi:hypothetical protein